MKSCCPSCNKIFTRKSALDYHVNHNVCLKSNNKICPECGKKFSTVQMCHYHIKHGVCMNETIVKPTVILKEINEKMIPKEITGETTEEIIGKISTNDMTTEQMKHRIAHLEGENKALKEHPQTVNQTINIVVPPAFLSIENYEQTMKHLPNLLHEALSRHPSNFIRYLIQETNCNPQLPLYNSIRITNQKSQIIHVSDGKEYIFASRKQIIDDLIQNKRDILQEYVDQNGERYGEKILKRYENYLEALDTKKDVQKELEIDIIVMLLNMSKIICSDEWSRKLLDNLISIE